MQELPVIKTDRFCSLSLCRGLISSPPVVFSRQPALGGPADLLPLCCTHYVQHRGDVTARKVVIVFAKAFGTHRFHLSFVNIDYI